MPNAELIPAQLQATLGQDDGASSISADGQALLVNGGPGDTVARMHFTLPARTVHGDPWVVWVERKPVERLQLAGEGWHSVEHGFFRPDPDDGQMPTGYEIGRGHVGHPVTIAQLVGRLMHERKK